MVFFFIFNITHRQQIEIQCILVLIIIWGTPTVNTFESKTTVRLRIV